MTLEDILEEIVGDFTTNQADPDDDVCVNDDGSFTLEGSATVREINKITNWNLPTDGPKTLNGLVLEALEQIPDGNVCFRFSNYTFETLSLSAKRVNEVKAWCHNRFIQEHEDEH